MERLSLASFGTLAFTILTRDRVGMYSLISAEYQFSGKRRAVVCVTNFEELALPAPIIGSPSCASPR